MQRVAGMSVVVRAHGVSEAFYNGQRDRVVEAVRAEAEERIRQANAETEKARSRAEMQEQKCNRLRKQEMEALRADHGRGGIAGRIENVWACTWATLATVVELAWCYLWGGIYELKLVEYDGDE